MTAPNMRQPSRSYQHKSCSEARPEDAISLKPMFVRHLKVPNVVIVPIADKGATWDVFVAWQRGKIAGPLRALLDALILKPNKSS